VDADRALLWHPYDSAIAPAPVLPVVGAQGVRLELADGRRVIDAMSSWWAAIHGYRHPVLDAAVREQLDSMAHVMFGGLTHPAAVGLAQRLVDLTPDQLRHVFLTDSGSVAVEVAVKMALQYWQATGTPRNRLLTVRGGYHGDTFAAMSLCDPVSGMHHLFSGVLPKHHFAPRPPDGSDAPSQFGDRRDHRGADRAGRGRDAVPLPPVRPRTASGVRRVQDVADPRRDRHRLR
jgi:adenosylmethionine-8-amino-7-oxononanoate aminotransferase